MQITDRYVRIPLEQIRVKRDERQRRAIYDEHGQFINNDGLLEDIAAHGVLNPIIISADFYLVAGERRFEASRTLGNPDAPCRFVEDLSPEEAEILELSENIRRTDLPWRDEVRAVTRLHELYSKSKVGWTIEDTARTIGGYAQLSISLRVGRELAHPSIANVTSVRQAWNVLTRRDERTKADAAADIQLAGIELFEGIATSALVANPSPADPGSDAGEAGESTTSSGGASFEPSSTATLEPATSAIEQESVLLADFREWAPRYIGPRFNLVHCDFPYSVGAFEGEYSGRDRWETYDDSKEARAFEELVICLCANLDALVAPSAHLMFWLPADTDIQAECKALFRDLAPSWEFWPKPLIWHKTDNVGVLADPKRKPRHVYETALVASREDRLIASATSDCYGSPTDKQHHPSTKPEPMLRYFFQLFVDEHTRLLDPTCGSGSALRAAESLGAGFVLGLEASPEHHANASKALKQFRVKRAYGGR